MSHDLDAIIRQLSANIASSDHSTSTSLLTRAKLNLLHQNALIPSASTPHALLHSAQHVLELGALISIRMQDAPAFTRYFQQLQPFYTLSSPQQQPSGGTGDKYKSERSKVTGLYLLLLLSQGDYAGFHTQLEALEAVAEEQGVRLEEDEFVRYPVRLEQWLMEGSYDRMWKGTRGNEVPSEEFAVFSNVSPIDSSRGFTGLGMHACMRTYLARSHNCNADATDLCRYSSARSAPRLPHAAKRPTPPFRWPMQSRSSSSTPRAAWSASRSSAAGRRKTGVSTSPPWPRAAPWTARTMCWRRAGR